MLAIGNGLGPKNVLVELDDGNKVVVTYRTWKYKYKERKSVADYATIIGFIQFPVTERDAGDQTVHDVTIRTPGTNRVPGGGQLIRITIWPELWEELEENSKAPAEGDFIAVDGQLSVREDGDRTYVNMNAKNIAVNPGYSVSNTEREVVNTKKERVF